MKHAHALFPLLIATLLAIASFWLAYVVQQERSGGNAGALRHDPDTIIKTFEVDRFDKNGHLQSHLDAKELRHYPDNDTADLDEPRAIFNDPKREMIWTSDRATGSNETQIITMFSNVRGVRPATAERMEEQVMTTEELTINVDDETAYTDKPVTFTQGQSRTDSVGAHWDNISGILQLQQVRSTLYKSDRK